MATFSNLAPVTVRVDGPDGSVTCACSQVQVNYEHQDVDVTHLASPLERLTIPGFIEGVVIRGKLLAAPQVASRESPAPPTLEDALCLAIKDGDIAAAFALLDDLLEKHGRPEGFVERKELVDVLRSLEREGGTYPVDSCCPCCMALGERPGRTAEPHLANCRLARAIGAERSPS